MSLLMLFIDGIGIGRKEHNPLVNNGLSVLSFHEDSLGTYDYMGGELKAIDANLGIDGLPQSATGQTTIFTGINASQVLGKHLSGMPSTKLRELLRKTSIFLRLKNAGKKVLFANAFTPVYFLYPITRISASSLHMMYAGLRPRWIWEIAGGGALFQDFTNEPLIEAGFELPHLNATQAGKILAGMTSKYDFVLYEYFLTDAAAHGRIKQKPHEILKQLDKMLEAVLENIDLTKHSVLLCSDHGNIEDGSTRSHTRNPVPLIAWGPKKEDLMESTESITDICSSVCRYFEIG